MKKPIRLEETEAQVELLDRTYPHLHLLNRLMWLEDAVAQLRSIESRLAALEEERRRRAFAD